MEDAKLTIGFKAQSSRKGSTPKKSISSKAKVGASWPKRTPALNRNQIGWSAVTVGARTWRRVSSRGEIAAAGSASANVTVHQRERKNPRARSNVGRKMGPVPAGVGLFLFQS